MLLIDLIGDRVDADWVLFLDRDGVLNRRIVDGYVLSWDEFEFLPGAVEAVADLSTWAPNIVIVTNQQGVGKGLISNETLDGIHQRMVKSIEAAGGRIDAVLSCPHLAAEGCQCRKPEAGLPVEWLTAHPELDGNLSMMVGDSPSDISMARKLAESIGPVVAVGIGDDRLDADINYASLAQFASEVRTALQGNPT